MMDPHADWVPLTWDIEEQGHTTTVVFHGEIDENVDFGELRQRLRGAVVFDLQDVRRINSCGVREWVNFVRELPDITELVLARCSPAAVTQINMIYNFRGKATIRSIHAPYICPSCELEEERLIEIEAAFPDRDIRRMPTFPCPSCGEPMEFDDIPARYLSFLLDM